MLTLEQIMVGIGSLPVGEYASLRNWFWEKDWAKWDKRIKKDSDSGALDFLIEEALQEKEKGRLKRL